jgi:predicted small metal-binding protein
MKKLKCTDIGVDCDVEFIAETEDEIMVKASEHAKLAHNLPVIPPNIDEKCRAAITEFEPADEESEGGEEAK